MRKPITMTSIKRYCPECGSGSVVKNAHEKDGTQRYKCTTCGHRPDHPLLKPPIEVLDCSRYIDFIHELINSGKPCRLLITAAQNATPIFMSFFETCQNYCRLNTANLIVIPYRYHNPTSVWTTDDNSQNWWDKNIVQYLINERITLNQNLILMGDIKTQPTAVRPLEGFEGITQDKSGIFAHPKVELLSVPTPQNKLPKMLATTGAITKKNYTDSKAGKKGEFHHTFGGVVIEIERNKFHMRQVIATRDGSFCDLEYEYKKKERKPIKADALILGDTHYEFMNSDVRKATFEGAESITQVLKPKYIIHHDAWDGYAISHHHDKEPFIQYSKHQTDRNDVFQSLKSFFEFIDKITPEFSTNIFVASNHPEFLMRWIKEANPKTDHTNALFWTKTYQYLLENTQATNTGTATPDPFDYWARQLLKSYKKSRFLKRDESFVIKDIELGYHGDKGPNGSRGTPTAYTKIGVKVVTGHVHSCGIKDGVYTVGTSGNLKMDYVSGPSSWLNCHCILYPNGKRSLIVILPGAAWRLV